MSRDGHFLRAAATPRDGEYQPAIIRFILRENTYAMLPKCCTAALIVDAARAGDVTVTPIRDADTSRQIKRLRGLPR